MVGIATTRNRTIHAGALVKIDARNQRGPASAFETTSTRRASHASTRSTRNYEILTPEVPTGNGPSPVGRYREPSMLPDGRILVSWADGPVNDLHEQSVTPPDFGIYVFDPKTQEEPARLQRPRQVGRSARSRSPRAPSRRSSAISSAANDATNPARIGSVDITNTSLATRRVTGAQFADTPLREALKKRRQGPHHRGLLERRLRRA